MPACSGTPKAGESASDDSLPPVQAPAEPMLPFDDFDPNGGLEFEDVPGAVIDAPEDDPAEDGAPEKED